NLLTVDGARYLVAPRGVTQWVRNIRAAGEAELRVGRRVEPIRVVELADDEKPALLRAYLSRWKFEVGVFFDGVDASASDETLRRIAPGRRVGRGHGDPCVPPGGRQRPVAVVVAVPVQPAGEPATCVFGDVGVEVGLRQPVREDVRLGATVEEAAAGRHRERRGRAA